LPSSTRFGSTKINLTSSGVALNKIEHKKALTQTDLPEPVAPAIKRCGISEMSATTGLPATSTPKLTANLEGCFLSIGEDNIVFSGTISAL